MHRYVSFIMFIFILAQIASARLGDESLIQSIVFRKNDADLTNPVYPPFASWDSKYTGLFDINYSDKLEIKATAMFPYPQLYLSVNNEPWKGLANETLTQVSLTKQQNLVSVLSTFYNKYHEFVNYTYEFQIFISSFSINATFRSSDFNFSGSSRDNNCTVLQASSQQWLSLRVKTEPQGVITVRRLSYVSVDDYSSVSQDSLFNYTSFFGNLLENVLEVTVSNSSARQIFFFRFHKSIGMYELYYNGATFDIPVDYHGWDLMPRFHPEVYNYSLVRKLPSSAFGKMRFVIKSGYVSVCFLRINPKSPVVNYTWVTEGSSTTVWMYIKEDNFNFFCASPGLEVYTKNYTIAYYRKSNNVYLKPITAFINPLVEASGNFRCNSSELPDGFNYKHDLSKLTTWTDLSQFSAPEENWLSYNSFTSNLRFYPIQYPTYPVGVSFVMIPQDPGGYFSYQLIGGLKNFDYFYSAKSIYPLKPGNNSLVVNFTAEDRVYSLNYVFTVVVLDPDTSIKFMFLNETSEGVKYLPSNSTVINGFVIYQQQDITLQGELNNSNSAYEILYKNQTVFTGNSTLNLKLPIDSNSESTVYTVRVYAESRNWVQDYTLNLSKIDTCGDGRRWASAEECDDGNTDSNDGCYQCLVEANWTCSGGSFVSPDNCTIKSDPLAPSANNSEPQTNSTNNTQSNDTNTSSNNTDPTTNGNNTQSNTTDPNSNATDPNANATDPNANTTDPNANTTDPKANTTDPKANTTDPKANTTDPNANTTDPNTNITDPSSNKTDNPTNNTNQPTNNTDNPTNSSSHNPSTNTSQPSNNTEPSTNSSSGSNTTDPPKNSTNESDSSEFNTSTSDGSLETLSKSEILQLDKSVPYLYIILPITVLIAIGHLISRVINKNFVRKYLYGGVNMSFIPMIWTFQLFYMISCLHSPTYFTFFSTFYWSMISNMPRSFEVRNMMYYLIIAIAILSTIFVFKSIIRCKKNFYGRKNLAKLFTLSAFINFWKIYSPILFFKSLNHLTSTAFSKENFFQLTLSLLSIILIILIQAYFTYLCLTNKNKLSDTKTAEKLEAFIQGLSLSFKTLPIDLKKELTKLDLGVAGHHNTIIKKVKKRNSHEYKVEEEKPKFLSCPWKQAKCKDDSFEIPEFDLCDPLEEFVTEKTSPCTMLRTPLFYVHLMNFFFAQVMCLAFAQKISSFVYILPCIKVFESIFVIFKCPFSCDMYNRFYFHSNLCIAAIYLFISIVKYYEFCFSIIILILGICLVLGFWWLNLYELFYIFKDAYMHKKSKSQKYSNTNTKLELNDCRKIIEHPQNEVFFTEPIQTMREHPVRNCLSFIQPEIQEI